MEQSLYVEFDELFALRERLPAVADHVRAQLFTAGLREPLEAEVFDGELELRSADGSNLVIRLDSYRLEIAGVRRDVAIHLLAALILAEAEAFRLTSVEMGLTAWYQTGGGRSLNLVAQAFPVVEEEEAMLDRRLAISWEWATATTMYSFQASVAEDKELVVSLKVREGYMTLPELQAGTWVDEQAVRFQQLSDRFLAQLGWTWGGSVDGEV